MLLHILIVVNLSSQIISKKNSFWIVYTSGVFLPPSSSHPNTFFLIQKNIYEFTFLKTISDEANGVSHKRAKNKLQIFFYSKLHKNDKSVDLSMYILKCSDLSDFVMFV